ncbi:MAG: cysteine desulfurase [candidate division Zixibacteria bacterium]|nr:cysteine desulfurase [candidate division Zixibacteria bacterium]NIR67053.1 cysteine desulfurase [candidate division Zixibacteria bacterium]NIS15626.1 cysteine desulfurase [candidate division Zixibacteria bacterium]NIS48464.1 cysteine desulfurase [candidate division Zixibacteria bacterium]NIT52135.1 cysteine desulfurase [candidate division Zixibacteria bacterium]
MSDDRKIYFDHQATTPVDYRVLDEMIPYFSEHFGNPSSHIHKEGVRANAALDTARKRVAELVNSKPEEIIFTSCATESNNLAVQGFLKANPDKGKHIIISEIEHYSILNLVMRLKSEGYDVTAIKVDQGGLIDPEVVSRAVRDDTALISINLANSEIGTIQPIKQIASIAREQEIFMHTDGAIAVGNIPVDVNDLGIDALTMSAHNYYGPKGAAALYLKKGTDINPLFEGGFQEYGLRSGTENVPGIVGMGAASALARAEMPARTGRLTKLGKMLWKGLEEEIEYINFTGHPEKRLPGHVSFWIKYIEGESLLLMLNIKGVMAASGSACSSNLRGEDEEDLAASHVLTAIGVPAEFCSGSLTVSLGKDSTQEEVQYLLDIMPEVVEKLLMMSPLYADKLRGKDPYS